MKKLATDRKSLDSLWEPLTVGFSSTLISKWRGGRSITIPRVPTHVNGVKCRALAVSLRNCPLQPLRSYCLCLFPRDISQRVQEKDDRCTRLECNKRSDICVVPGIADNSWNNPKCILHESLICREKPNLDPPVPTTLIFFGSLWRSIWRLDHCFFCSSSLSRRFSPTSKHQYLEYSTQKKHCGEQWSAGYKRPKCRTKQIWSAKRVLSRLASVGDNFPPRYLQPLAYCPGCRTSGVSIGYTNPPQAPRSRW